MRLPLPITPVLACSLVLYCLAVLPQATEAIRTLRFASPLQSLTFPDPELRDEEDLNTPRKRFLPKFFAGLTAEASARKEVALKRSREVFSSDLEGPDWADKTAASEKARREKEEAFIESVYDEAIAGVEAVEKALDRGTKMIGTKAPNKYQFVGVVDRKKAAADASSPITWYARKKPARAKWSLRLIHVNQDAIIKDLFNRGKIDIFAKYKNTGVLDEETKTPIVTSRYEVRERSWKNMWNFSPKHFFTDSSGSYWRERRLRPGMYTDGVNVYEASYRYRDGRNGMHRVSTFQQFLRSASIDPQQKSQILKRLQGAEPDVVLEL